MFTAPTAAEFIARYPQFAGQETMINLVLVEAQMQVGQNWVDQANYTRGIMLWTAHTLTVDTETSVSGGVDNGMVLSAESFGPISMAYTKSTETSAGDYGEFSGTTFGQQFYNLRRQNVGGPVVVGGGEYE